MTFEQFQDSRGRNTSNKQDYEEYLAFLQESGVMNKAVSKKKLSQATDPEFQKNVKPAEQKAPVAPQQVQTQLDPSKFTPSLDGAMLTDGFGMAGQLDAGGKIKSAGRTSAGVQTPTTPKLNTPAPSSPGFFDEGGAWDQTEFTGDAKGIAAAGMMGIQTANAQTASQAIMGGAMTGMSVGSMLTGAAAGPVGAAVGVGSALIGLANASSQRRKREQAEARAREEQERLMKKQEKLRSLENYNNRRQRAYESLMGAFR